MYYLCKCLYIQLMYIGHGECSNYYDKSSRWSTNLNIFECNNKFTDVKPPMEDGRCSSDTRNTNVKGEHRQSSESNLLMKKVLFMRKYYN